MEIRSTTSKSMLRALMISTCMTLSCSVRDSLEADYSDIGRSNTSYDEGVMLMDIFADTSIDMTGILLGDVDGSFIA